MGADRTISTHAPRTGSDASCICVKPFFARFQPTLPARGATIIRSGLRDAIDISTHAPRTGSDMACGHNGTAEIISTHAPRTGSDALRLRAVDDVATFQPTLPARGATSLKRMADKGNAISTHAPRTGSDGLLSSAQGSAAKFQPTLPARGATLYTHDDVPGYEISTHAPRTGSDCCCYFQGDVTIISTHAPRTGSDTRWSGFMRCHQHFNPRSPHGERHHQQLHICNHQGFQPTLPARGATLMLGLS